MKRVQIVNLAGRAFHIEADGVAAVEAWLDHARSRLAADPDCEELINDFEATIADRFAATAPDARDVVTVEHARHVLALLGDVHPAEDPASSAAPEHDAATVAMPTAPGDAPPGDGAASDSWSERKLYRFTDGSEMLAGVCAGLAAYLRVDVTIVRVAMVILAFLTSGIAVLVYIIMALVVPEADTPDKRAAAHGHGQSAQEMIRRARDGAGPALGTLGSLIASILRVLLRIVFVVLVSVAVLAGLAWVAQVTWLYINGGGITGLFDEGTPTTMIALWVTSLAWLVAGFALAMATAVRVVMPSSGRRSRRGDVALGVLWSAATIAAVVGAIAIPATFSEQLRSIEDGDARVELYGQTICFVHESPPRDEDRWSWGRIERELTQGDLSGCDEVVDVS